MRELRLPDGGPRLGAGRRHERRRGARRSRGRRRRACRPSCSQPFEHGRSIIRGEARRRASCAGCSPSVISRPQPGLDDKVLASWNGLALAALAEGARRLERSDWLDAARGVGEFLLGPLSRERRAALALVAGGKGQRRGLPRRLRERRARAARAPRRDRRGALAARGASARAARRRAVRTIAANGGFFLAPTGGEELVARTKGLDDNPIPSGNSMLAHVLLRLGRIWGDDELERQACRCCGSCEPMLGRAPGAFGWALCALDLWLAPPREIAIVGAGRQPRGSRGARSVRAEHGRRGRACGRRAAARGQGPRRRQAGGLRLRAVRLPGARDRPDARPPLRVDLVSAP